MLKCSWDYNFVARSRYTVNQNVAASFFYIESKWLLAAHKHFQFSCARPLITPFLNEASSSSRSFFSASVSGKIDKFDKSG